MTTKKKHQNFHNSKKKDKDNASGRYKRCDTFYHQAKKSGFDLVFTKSMLIKSIKKIIIHISNEKRNT